MTRPSVLLFLGLVAVALGAFESDLDGILDGDVLQKFQEFLNNFNKTCDPGSTDCLQRQQNFANNLEQLKKFPDSSDDGAKFGMNHFMDWSLEEMKRMTFNHESIGPIAEAPFVGAIRAKRQSVPGPVYEEEVVLLDVNFLDPFLHFSSRTMNDTDTWDWRTTGTVNPVRDQGQCGSCWAFATVASIEVQTNYKSNRTTPKDRVQYSEQYVLDCAPSDGCNGGWPATAINYVQKKGITAEGNLKYTAKKAKKCPKEKVQKPVLGQVDLTGNVQAIQSFVRSTGPATAAFYVCKDFYYYKSGVYSTDCDPNNPDYEGGHAVTIVGYGTSPQGVPYWLVRNSWGTNWGMQGYFWMKRGTDPSSFESWGNTGPHTHAM